MKNRVVSKILNALWLLLVFSIIIGAFLWLIYAFNIFSFKDIWTSFRIEKTNETDNEKYENVLLDLLPDNISNSKQYSFLDLSSDKARELLYSFEAPENYFWEVETYSGIQNAKRNQTHRIYKKGNKIRVDTIDKYIDMTTVFADNNTVIKNNKTGEIRKISNDTDFSYDNIINLASLVFLFSETEQKINFISVEASDGLEFLYVEFPKNKVNGIDEYFISLDYGIVFSATSKIDDEIVFSQKTINIDTKSMISDETFEIIN